MNVRETMQAMAAGMERDGIPATEFYLEVIVSQQARIDTLVRLLKERPWTQSWAHPYGACPSCQGEPDGWGKSEGHAEGCAYVKAIEKPASKEA